jgi:outer membrane protein assembly factor BamB
VAAGPVAIGQRYALGRLVGRGTTCEVFAAEDLTLGQRIAIKRSPDVARLRRCVTFAQRVTHPNVVRVFDVEPALGVCTMELLAGEPLAARLARGRIPAAEARRIAADVDAAIAAMHAAGVVHGEVSPAHVVVCGDRAVLVGFAAAGLADPATMAADRRGAAAIRSALDPRARQLPWRTLAIAAAVIAALALVPTTPSSARPLAIQSHAGATIRVAPLGGVGKEMIEDSARDAHGALYLAGHHSVGSRLGDAPLPHPGGGGLAAFVARVDADGRLAWHRAIAAGGQASLIMVAVDRDQVLAAGHLRGEAAIGIVLALAPDDGRVLWRRELAASGGSEVKAAAVDVDGTVYVAGVLRGTIEFAGVTRAVAGFAPFIAAIDRDGAPRWLVTGDGADGIRVRGLAIAGDAVVVAGEVAGTITLGDARWTQPSLYAPFVVALATDDGAVRWVRPMPTHDGRAFALAADTDRVVVGGTFYETLDLGTQVLASAATAQVAWTAALDPKTGVARWGTRVGAGAYSATSAIALLPGDELLAAIEYGDAFTVGGRRLVAAGGVDVVLVELRAGAVVGTAAFTGASNERVRRIRPLLAGSVAVNGRHTGLRLGEVELAGGGFSDGFYAELRLDELLVPAVASSPASSPSPAPASAPSPASPASR